MLKVLFDWLDGHPQCYWIIAAAPTGALLGWIAWTLVSRTPNQAYSKRNEAIYAFLLLCVLLAWRWPFLLSADEYNPDESQLIAGAMTLRFDPIPWRGVDGFTSGPLNFYPLAAVQQVGLPLDYFTARMTALLLIWGALLASYRVLRALLPPALSRLSLLPVLGFFSTVTNSDFIHYSSEHLSLFLTAISACCIIRSFDRGEIRARWQVAGCFVAGMLPLAKLQSAPIAAALVALSLFSGPNGSSSVETRLQAWRKRILAALAPTVFLVALVACTGQFAHFSRSYLLQNFVYVGDGGSIVEVAGQLWRISRSTGHFIILVALCLGGAGLKLLAKRPVAKPEPWWIGGALLSVASVISILGPRRALLHYVLLSIIPLGLWYGIGVGRYADTLHLPNQRKFGFALLVLGCLPFVFRGTQQTPEIFGAFASHWREPRSALGSLLRLNKSAGSRLAIWGWLPKLYVESALPQGTRDGNSSWAMMPSPYREYYKQRFVADLRQTNPDFFVDAVGIGAPFFHDRTQAAHESFPQLAEYVAENYQLVTDLGYARFYAKQGRTVQMLPENAQLRSPLAKDAFDDVEPLIRESLSPPDLPVQEAKTGRIQMMNPPAEMVWMLDDTTREIIFEYGFSPEAYRQNRTDGVELIFELRSEGVPLRHLFYRLLNPVRRSSDRGPVTERLILPPFKSGARLVARTTVGIAGDNAWDLFYLGRVIPIRMPRFSPAQFPNFNRVPDLVDADLSYRLQESNDSRLILHAPALLTYTLTGDERRVRFDYGFQEGAYSNGGQTDGASFQVELHRPNATVQTLFRNELRPTGNPEDRGAHPADFVIPRDSAGAKLIIRIDPGKGNAWDWTYLTNFVLE